MEILFDVQNQIITRLDSNYIVEKSQEYLIAKFKFTDDWQNTQKFIIFETDNDPVRMEIINDECVIPSQVIIYPNFQFSIKGIGISNSNYVITTNLKNISILKTGFGNGVSPLPPVPTYEEKVNKAYVDIESIFDSSTGVITLTFTNNSGNKKIINIDLPTEQLVKDVRYDNSSNEIVITWENGQVSRIPLENLKGTEVVANNDQAVTSFLKTLSVDKINYAIPTKVSDLVNDSNFITNTSNSFDYNNLSNKPTIPTNTSQLNNDSGFITNGVNNLQNYYTKEEIDTTCLKQGDNVTFNAMNVNSIAQFFGDVNLSYGKVYVQNLLTTDEKSYLEANPELNGTEENLTSVTISGRNYKINSNGDSSTNPVISQSFTIPLTQGNTNIDNFKRELTAEEIAIIESKPEKLDFNLIINLDNEGVTLATLDSIYTITQKMTLDGMLNYDGDFLIDISGTGTADYDHAYSYVQISISKQIGDQTYMLRINSFTRAERQADGYTAGVVNPTLKTTEMTQEVGIDTTDGKLYTKASLTIDEVQALIDTAIGNVLTEEF